MVKAHGHLGDRRSEIGMVQSPPLERSIISEVIYGLVWVRRMCFRASLGGYSCD